MQTRGHSNSSSSSAIVVGDNGYEDGGDLLLNVAHVDGAPREGNDGDEGCEEEGYEELHGGNGDSSSDHSGSEADSEAECAKKEGREVQTLRDEGGGEEEEEEEDDEEEEGGEGEKSSSI